MSTRGKIAAVCIDRHSAHRADLIHTCRVQRQVTNTQRSKGTQHTLREKIICTETKRRVRVHVSELSCERKGERKERVCEGGHRWDHIQKTCTSVCVIQKCKTQLLKININFYYVHVNMAHL